jgi:hypothetical protein
MKHIILFCLFTQVLYAQPGFNIGHDYGYYFNYFNDIVVQNDTLIAYGLAQDTVWPYKQAVLVARFDSTGIPIDNVLVQDTAFNLFSMDTGSGKILSTKDGGYIMTTLAFYGGDGVVIKLNHQLGIEFVTKFPDTINGSEFLVAPIEIPDGYLLYGFFKREGNSKHDAILRKIDKQGNLVWRKTFGEPDWNESFRKLTFINDSILILSGVRYFTSSLQGSFLPWVWAFDLSGNELWNWTTSTLNEFDSIFPYSIKPSETVGWIAYGYKYLGQHPEYNFQRHQPYWIKLNENFGFEWAKPFGPSVANTAVFFDIIEAPNKDLIGIGKRGPFDYDPATYYQKGWIMRFSPEADSIWEWTGKMPAVNPKAHHFAGGDLLSSGSIVAAGQGESATGNWYCWLVKLSPDGCLDTLFCHPTVSTVTTPLSAEQIRVFPNPAVGQVSIVLENAPDVVGGVVHFYDLLGRLVAVFPTGQTVYPLSGVAPGLYEVRILSAQGQPLGSKRLVVGR